MNAIRVMSINALYRNDEPDGFGSMLMPPPAS
jgi:hypothetical protein